MSRQDSKRQEKMMSRIYRGKEIFKPLNTGIIDEHVKCIREFVANIFFYTKDEAKARKWNIQYIQRIFPNVELIINKGQDHAECFTLHPEQFCTMIKNAISGELQEHFE